MRRASWLSVVAFLGLVHCSSNNEQANMGGGSGAPAVAGTSAAGLGAGGAAGAVGGASGSNAAGAPGSGGATGASGCGSESFAAIYQSVFANTTYNCNGPLCHGRDAAMASTVGNLSMSSAAVAYSQLVGKSSDGTMCAGKTRVIPGDPTNSLLVQKLRGETTTCGAPMPVNADQLTDPELKRITDWIRGGACNN